MECEILLEELRKDDRASTPARYTASFNRNHSSTSNPQNGSSSPRGPSRTPPLESGEQYRGGSRNRSSDSRCWKCGEVGHWQEPDTVRLQSINIPEDAVIPNNTDNRPFVIVTIGEVQFYALIDTGASRSFASELVARCCCVIGLKPIEQAVTQSRQADGSICAITQAFLQKMRIGQEQFEHEILLLPRLAVDIVLGIDVLRGREFQIQLTNNKISLTQNIVPAPVAQSVLTLQHSITEEESMRSNNVHGEGNTGLAPHEERQLKRFLDFELPLFQENQGLAHYESREKWGIGPVVPKRGRAPESWKDHPDLEQKHPTWNPGKMAILNYAQKHIDIARKIVEKTDEYGIMADQQHPRVEYEEHTFDNLQDELNIVNIVKQNKIAEGPSHPEQSHQLTSQEKKFLYPRLSQVILDM
ncbi:hypothetical protein JTB14_010053 [Gonioctena quinquepunctata]|nr:hypothetical protein JTB14_010053 [Gonioctena quinquepunctata]